MKLINIAKTIWIFNWCYYIIYNVYFGFNWEPQSIAESNCDTVFKVVVYGALILYLIPLFRIYEKAVRLFLSE